jgi:hypothetical protein
MDRDGSREAHAADPSGIGCNEQTRHRSKTTRTIAGDTSVKPGMDRKKP